jgi:hypothetical protein
MSTGPPTCERRHHVHKISQNTSEYLKNTIADSPIQCFPNGVPRNSGTPQSENKGSAKNVHYSIKIII